MRYFSFPDAFCGQSQVGGVVASDVHDVCAAALVRISQDARHRRAKKAPAAYDKPELLVGMKTSPIECI